MPEKDDSDFLIFAGTASADLAASIARHFGIRLGASSVNHFPDGEVSVKLQIISVAPLIAGAIQRFMNDGSLSDLC